MRIRIAAILMLGIACGGAAAVALSTPEAPASGAPILIAPVVIASIATPAVPVAAAAEIPMPAMSAKAALGKRLFFEAKLSRPEGQSCSSCHTPGAGFTDPDHSAAVSTGVLKDRVGFRNTPSAAYASFCPPLHYEEADETYVGGLFLDGRVDGLEAQAKEPLLNPLEMHNADAASVVKAVASSDVAPLFESVYGSNALDPSRAAEAIKEVGEAIAAYESSAEVNQFSSKFDAYLKGKAKLTAREMNGQILFIGKACCAECHPSTVKGTEPAPLFTDFSYDNIGIPKNWQSPYLKLPSDLNPDGWNFVDVGLEKTIAVVEPARAAEQAGKFKVPTLRNLDSTAPYGHNGYFTTLKDIVHFYNTRDVPGTGWDIPEVRENVNEDELGNLGLTDEEEDDLVAFMKTLNDGYKPRRP